MKGSVGCGTIADVGWKCGNRGSETASDPPKVTQQVRKNTGLWDSDPLSPNFPVGRRRTIKIGGRSLT